MSVEKKGCWYIDMYIYIYICEHELIYVRSTFARSSKENWAIWIMWKEYFDILGNTHMHFLAKSQILKFFSSPYSSNEA